jgi:hypothetical protein
LKSARYGTGEGTREARRSQPFSEVSLSGCFLCFPPSSRRSCDQMDGVGRQNWVRGRIPIFRKIHLYGKSAKSTHGHTNAKPTWPVFSHLAIFRLPRPPCSGLTALNRLPYSTNAAYPTPNGLPCSDLPYTKSPTLHQTAYPTAAYPALNRLPCSRWPQGPTLPIQQQLTLHQTAYPAAAYPALIRLPYSLTAAYPTPLSCRAMPNSSARQDLPPASAYN